MSDLLDHIRSRIEALGMGFQFLTAIKTNMNGVERETWLLEYEGSQFVFVAGQKGVTLGWDTDKCPLGNGILNGLQEEFDLGHEHYQAEMEEMRNDYQKQIKNADENGDSAKADELRSELEEELAYIQDEMTEGGYTAWEDFIAKWNEQLSQCLSPLRTTDIGDMIVETDSRYLDKDALSLEQVVPLLKEGPFTLATEDEWEYFCNGGTRTLFRWGDTLNDVTEEIYNVGSVSNVRDKPILERPNMLGIFIAYDSYKCEIIDNVSLTKGGDGGCSLCGGDGAVYVLPCYTAFYRHPIDTSNNYKLSKNFYCYRRIVRLP